MFPSDSPEIHPPCAEEAKYGVMFTYELLDKKAREEKERTAVRDRRWEEVENTGPAVGRLPSSQQGRFLLVMLAFDGRSVDSH